MQDLRFDGSVFETKFIKSKHNIPMNSKDRYGS